MDGIPIIADVVFGVDKLAADSIRQSLYYPMGQTKVKELACEGVQSSAATCISPVGITDHSNRDETDLLQQLSITF